MEIEITGFFSMMWEYVLFWIVVIGGVSIPPMLIIAVIKRAVK